MNSMRSSNLASVGSRLIFGVVIGLIAGGANAAEKPNILFVFADDWVWGDLGCHGYPFANKPLFWKSQSARPIPRDRPHHWVSYAVVHENWKLLANHDLRYRELYDISADPFEQNDLREKQPETVSRLVQMLSEWKAVSAELSRPEVLLQ